VNIDIEKINGKIKQVLDYYSSYGMKVYSREFDIKRKTYLQDVLIFCVCFRIPTEIMFSKEKDLPKSVFPDLSFVFRYAKETVERLVTFREEQSLSVADVVDKLKSMDMSMTRQNFYLFEAGSMEKINLDLIRCLLKIYGKTFDDLCKGLEC
jgi:hypothetical protein